MSAALALKPTPAQLATLRAAAERPRGTLCPCIGARGQRVYAGAEAPLLQSIYRRGWGEPNGCVPIITGAGRAIAKAAPPSPEE